MHPTMLPNPSENGLDFYRVGKINPQIQKHMIKVIKKIPLNFYFDIRVYMYLIYTQMIS